MKLLIVDDHPVFREGLAQTLRQLVPKPEILKASNTEEARRLLATNPDIDLMIVDLLMPDETGIDLLKQISENTLIVPAVAMSGETNIQLIKSALKFGSLGFISKSSKPDEIQQAVKMILAGRYSLPDDVRRDLQELRDKGVPPVAKELGITRKQYSVLELMAEGLANRQIAYTLNLTEHTIKSHSQALFSALGVHNRTACVARAQALDLIHPARLP